MRCECQYKGKKIDFLDCTKNKAEICRQGTIDTFLLRTINRIVLPIAWSAQGMLKQLKTAGNKTKTTRTGTAQGRKQAETDDHNWHLFVPRKIKNTISQFLCFTFRKSKREGAVTNPECQPSPHSYDIPRQVHWWCNGLPLVSWNWIKGGKGTCVHGIPSVWECLPSPHFIGFSHIISYFGDFVTKSAEKCFVIFLRTAFCKVCGDCPSVSCVSVHEVDHLARAFMRKLLSLTMVVLSRAKRSVRYTDVSDTYNTVLSTPGRGSRSAPSAFLSGKKWALRCVSYVWNPDHW